MLMVSRMERLSSTSSSEASSEVSSEAAHAAAEAATTAASTEDVQFIDDVEHTVRIDGVVA